MKRFFILASAAIVALASCAKTEVVYNDAPEQIAFKQITGVMTKAPTALTTSMGVFAYRDGNSYFGKTEFANRNSEGYFTAETPVYWPVSGSLDFVLYAPFTGVTANSSSKDNLVFTKGLNEQLDLLYGKLTSAKSTDAVEVALHHALTRIDITVAGGSEISLKGVELLNTTQSATGTYDGTNMVWSAEDADVNKLATSGNLYTVANSTPANGDALNSTAKTCRSFYVVPLYSEKAQIKLTYRMNGYANDLTYSTDLETLTYDAVGKKYVYNFTIGASEIKLAPVVEQEWNTAASTNL